LRVAFARFIWQLRPLSQIITTIPALLKLSFSEDFSASNAEESAIIAARSARVAGG